MKSITIHGLEDHLSERIREEVRQQGLSLNKTIKSFWQRHWAEKSWPAWIGVRLNPKPSF